MGELAVGPELDALVAVKVFGWQLVDDPDMGAWFAVPDGDPTRSWPRHAFGSSDNPPAYSTDLAAAWTVVDHLVSQGLGSFGLERKLDGTWEVEWTSHGSDVPPRGIIHGGATPAEAITRAALALAEQARPPGVAAGESPERPETRPDGPTGRFDG